MLENVFLFQLYLTTSKGKGEAAEISIPITIATVPYRTQSWQGPDIHYGESYLFSLVNFIYCWCGYFFQKESLKHDNKVFCF